MRKRFGLAVLVSFGSMIAALACGPARKPAEKPIETPPPPSASVAVEAPDANVAPPVADAVDAGPVDAPPVVVAEEKLEGANLVAEVKAIYRVAACGQGEGALPPNIDADVVQKHCSKLEADYAEYKKEWLDVAGPFLAKLVPKGLPTTVIYPFGGGDLLGALATYPDGEKFTTISLESVGDVRGIMKADKTRIDGELTRWRDHVEKLFLKAHSRTVNMDIDSRAAIPGEVAFQMAALVVHGYEPTAFRYFDIEPNGQMHFLTDAEVAKADRKTGLVNAETRFRKKGGGPTKIIRHVAFDLSDGHLKKNPGLLRYLDEEAKSAGGKVSEMTKAASHLLWNDGNFSVIRDWLATHTDFMISDTTGFPPRIAKQYGFVQDFYGQYEWPEPFGPVNNRDATDFKNAFKGHAPISFRYGYPDNKSHGHIVVTHRP